MRHAPIATLIALVLLPAVRALGQTAKAPPTEQWDKATADITGTDAAARDAAIDQVKIWVKGGWVSQDLWRKWFPALVKAGKHQEIADLALLGILGRPGPEAITNLLDARFKALLALNKSDGHDELLACAKSYYNVCDLRYQMTNGVSYVAQALAKAHPEDADIVRKFRAEQTAAAAPTADTTPPTGTILSTVKIDAAPYKAALDSLKTKTKFTDQMGYADLLLVTDQGADAEKIFRDLYQTAATQEDLTAATEGIAKALRTQDGTVARANAWMAMINKMNATQPSNLPTAASLKPATTPPAAGGGTATPPRQVATRPATPPKPAKDIGLP